MKQFIFMVVLIPYQMLNVPLHLSYRKYEDTMSALPTTAYKDITLEHKPHQGYSIITMHKTPANTMTLTFLKQLAQALHEVETSPTSQALIITSSTNIFSAGMDLREFLSPDPKQFRTLWNTFQDVLIGLYSTRLLTVALVNGSAVGGGCALALCCDYRLAVEGGWKMGVNAVHLGMPVPQIVVRLLVNVLGQSVSEKFLLSGRLCVGSSEALQYGFVDRVVKACDSTQTVSTQMRKWLSIPTDGRAMTKCFLRRHHVVEFQRLKVEDTALFLKVVQNPTFQQHVRQYSNDVLGKKKNSSKL